MKLKYYTLVFYFLLQHALTYAQLKYVEYQCLYPELSFSKISSDNEGAWLISGDSTSIYRFNSAKEITKVSNFNGITSLKFTSIVSKGKSSVLVGTNTDSIFVLKNNIIKKLSITNGITLTNVTLVGDSISTLVGSSTLIYKGNKDNIFSVYEPSKDILKSSAFYSLFINNSNPASNYSSFGWVENTDLKLYIYTSDNAVIYTFPALKDEIPVSIFPIFGDWYAYYAVLATNKRLIFYDTYYNNFTSIYNEACSSLFYDDVSIYYGTNAGLKITNYYNYANTQTFSNDVSVSDIAHINSSFWYATNKGLRELRSYNKPDIENANFPIEYCKGSEIPSKVINTKLGDSISWYRNDTVIETNNANIIIDKIGKYKAIVSNKLYHSQDTTNILTVNLLTSIPDVRIYGSEKNCSNSDSIDIICGCYNSKSKSFFKDGVPYYNPIDTSSSSFYLKAKGAGVYWVETENCNGIKGISYKQTITFAPAPTFSYNVKNGSTVCPNDVLKITTNADNLKAYIYGSFYREQVKEIPFKEIGVGIAVDLHIYYSFKDGCEISDLLNLYISYLPYAEINQSGSTLNAVSQIKNSNGDVVLSYNIKDYQWYNGQQLINGATNASYLAPTIGEYKVKVTDNYGCSNYSKPFHVLSTDIPLIDNSFQVIPNPTKGKICLKSNSSSKLKKVEVYTLGGLFMYSQNTNFGNIDLSTFSNGIYLLKIYFDNDLIIKKLTLQK